MRMHGLRVDESESRGNPTDQPRRSLFSALRRRPTHESEDQAQSRGVIDPAMALEDLFRFVATIFDLHDHGLSGHSRRVADYAVALGTQMDVDVADKDRLRRAALVHEAAKAGVSNMLLRENPFLRPEEWQTVRSNTALIAQLMEAIPSLRDLAPITKHLRECWDGTGYPDRLERESIPLESRIIALCDAVETMTTERPYRGALTWHSITSQLWQAAGKQFDPAVVRAFFASTIAEEVKLICLSKEFRAAPYAGEVIEPQPSPLSEREIEILDYVAHGNSNKEVARVLSISDQTVKNHMSSILRKLAVNDRTQAAVLAMRYGWIKNPSVEAAPSKPG